MPLRLSLLLAAALLALSGSSAAPAQSLPAFAGADGAAAHVTGGRGGLVYHVTKLDKNYTDGGPGTLRYGLSDSNFNVGGVIQPRTIVFDVAGTFWLGRFGAESGHDNGWDTNSRYNLGSHVTIAGQTAPGPVTIMGGLVKASGTNAILRNVTIAPGYGMRNFSKPEEGVYPTPGDFPDSYVYDAIDITGTNLMIDHVTTAYATDETISANELANNVTIQYSNISQGQNYPQADAEASGVTYTGHGLGSLLQGGSNAKFSIHHNLYAHQKGRLPRVGSEVGTGAFNDFRNNVFYNWLGTAGGGASGQPSFNNFVGNFYRAGPGGDNPVGGASTAVTTANGGTGIFNGSNSSGTRVYHSGNLKDTNKDGDANDGVALANSDFGSSNFQAGPVWSGGVPTYNGVTDTATNAYNRVLDYMGANWWTRDNVIDTLDERIIHEVRTGTGKIKAWADDPFNPDPNEGVEWRAMLAKRADPVTGAAPYNRPADWDVDGDGMPGFWELAHGLDPSVADNNGDFDADGYTNLEEYVNDVAAWPAPTTIVFSDRTNQRYAQITNWDANPDAALTHRWQPSRYDVAAIQSGTAVVDAVGQHAGTLAVAPNAGNVATLNVTAGWIEVAAALQVGAAGQGSVNHSGGAVAASAITLGGSGANATGVYRLSGDGRLRVGQLTKGANGGSFEFTGGTLTADVVDFSIVNQGGVLSPGEWIGVTEIHGDLTMQSGVINLQIAAREAGGFDRLTVSGALAAGGTLRIEIVDNLVPAAGDSFDLFDFATASGAFALDLPTLPAGLAWDASGLLVTGALAVAAAPIGGADFNADGFVDGDDLAIWRAGFGSTSQTTNANGDADGNGVVDGADFLVWQQSAAAAVGAPSATVPEPAACLLLLLAAVSVAACHRLGGALRRPVDGRRARIGRFHARRRRISWSQLGCIRYTLPLRPVVDRRLLNSDETSMMLCSRPRVAFAAAFFVAAGVAGLASRAIAINVEPVLLQYQAVPGSDGFFHAPSISISALNNSRKVISWNGWPGDPFSKNGIFAWENGVLTDVLRSNDVQNAPGIGQPVIQTQPGFLDHNGNIAAPASFGDDQDDVNYIGPNRAGLAFVNRVEGANAPGNAAPWQPFVSVEGNNNGQMVFYGRVGNNDLGLWRGTSSANLVRLAQEDVTVVPGTAQIVRDVAFETPYVTSAGVAVFDVGYGPSNEDEAVLVGSSDANLQVVARTNYLDVPGLPAGTKFSGVHKEAINNAGHVVMGGDWGGFGNSGLFTTARGLLEPIALSGITAVPGVAGESFDSYMSSVTISGNDEIFFESESDVTATDGVFKWSNGTLSALALEGQPAPGTNSTFEFFNGIHTNAAGDLMFLAELADENVGLWHVAAGTTTLVRQLVTGMNIDVLGNGTDIRPIADMSMPSTFGGPQGGGNLRFNDHGDFIVKLTFEAGVNTRPLEGIYISSVVPEPGTLALAALAAVGALTFRRRD